jgi:hypothetical protein
MKLYINTGLAASRSDVPSTSLIMDSNQPWRLGYFSHVIFGTVNWSSGLSHVAIYDTALTQEQIEAHYEAAIGAPGDAPCGGGGPSPSLERAWGTIIG